MGVAPTTQGHKIKWIDEKIRQLDDSLLGNLPQSILLKAGARTYQFGLGAMAHMNRPTGKGKDFYSSPDDLTLSVYEKNHPEMIPEYTKNFDAMQHDIEEGWNHVTVVLETGGKRFEYHSGKRMGASNSQY